MCVKHLLTFPFQQQRLPVSAQVDGVDDREATWIIKSCSSLRHHALKFLRSVFSVGPDAAALAAAAGPTVWEVLHYRQNLLTLRTTESSKQVGRVRSKFRVIGGVSKGSVHSGTPGRTATYTPPFSLVLGVSLCILSSTVKDCGGCCFPCGT
jgi:hypothetical protein